MDYTGLGLILSLGSGDVELLSCFPIKGVAGTTPGFTFPHSKAQPLETGPEKYPFQCMDPRSHLICTPHRRVTPPGSPQFLVTGGYGPHPRPETDQDSCPGWLPPVPLDLVSPQEGFSLGPLSPRFKRFPATRILPITLCVFCATWHRAFMR